MNGDRASEELKIIRALMERPIRYSTMSGKSAILAGLAALVGLLIDWQVWEAATWSTFGTALVLSGVIWTGVLLTALTGTILLAWLAERRRGLPFWTHAKRRILAMILPIFLASTGLTAGIVLHCWRKGGSEATGGSELWVLIAPGWMLFYGVALWQLGLVSEKVVRVLAGAFLAAGVACCLVPALLYNPVLSMGLTFGGFHLVYGGYVWWRYGG